MNKFCYIATVPNSIHAFMRDIIQVVAEQNSVKVISHPQGSEVLDNLNAEFIPLDIERKPSVFKDLITLFKLIAIFKKERFDVIHSIMPKTGLLSMIAGFIARTPVRIHTFTGQVWCNKHGYERWLLKLTDKILVFCATHILVDSPSQRDFLVCEGVLKKDQAMVIGKGSICGVDTNRFKPNSNVRHRLRLELGVPDDAIVYLFLGRLNKDKGIQDLAKAFASVTEEVSNVHLLVVGPDEGGMDKDLELVLNKHKNQYHRVGFTTSPEDYMACADIFCLPSYREGFGSVVVEAAAVGLPSVASNIYGLVDAVKSEETGILHRPGNIEEIKNGLLILTKNNEMRKRMSNQAIFYANDYFSTDIVVNGVRDFYNSQIV